MTGHDPFVTHRPDVHRREFSRSHFRGPATTRSADPGAIATLLLRAQAWAASQRSRARDYVRHEPDTQPTALGVVGDAARATRDLLGLFCLGGIAAITIALPWIMLAGFVSLEVGFWFFVVAFTVIAFVCGGFVLERASLGRVALSAWLSALPVALGFGVIRGYL